MLEYSFFITYYSGAFMLVKKILGGFGMMSVLILLVSFAFFMYYLKSVKNYKFTTKTIVMIGLF